MCLPILLSGQFIQKPLIQTSMKKVLMLLCLVGGIALSNADAQSGCTPCPPGCCILSCCAPGKSSAATDQPIPATGATLVSFTPEAMSGTCQGKKMSNKEMKACIAACQSAATVAPSDNSHVATPTRVSSGTPAPSCHVPCSPGKTHSASAATTQPVPVVAVKQKS